MPRVDGDPGPHVAVPELAYVLRGRVLLLAGAERPDFIAFDPPARKVDQSGVLVVGARLPQLHQELGDSHRVLWKPAVRRASPGMMTRVSDGDDADVGRAPICPSCGVTALAAEASNVIDSGFVCENADCDAFGDVIESERET